jgi:hypothetical protein
MLATLDQTNRRESASKFLVFSIEGNVMKKCFSLHGVLLMCCSALLLIGLGCDQDAANEAMQEVETSAGDAAGALTDDAKAAMEKGKEMAGDAAAKGKEMASELGENAMSFLTPLKEKLGNLESLKDTPEKLKTAVSDLIASIEEKAEGLTMPEAISETLATLKAKLVDLKEYLGGEYEQSGIDEKVNDIVTSVKSGLGMTDK